LVRISRASRSFLNLRKPRFIFSFQFSLERLENFAPPPKDIVVVWERSKSVESTPPIPTSFESHTLIFSEHHALSGEVELIKENNDTFQDKEYKFTLRLGEETGKVLGHVYIDLSQYVQVPSASKLVHLRLSNDANLVMLINSKFLGKSKAKDSAKSSRKTKKASFADADFIVQELGRHPEDDLIGLDEFDAPYETDEEIHVLTNNGMQRTKSEHSAASNDADYDEPTNISMHRTKSEHSAAGYNNGDDDLPASNAMHRTKSEHSAADSNDDDVPASNAMHRTKSEHSAAGSDGFDNDALASKSMHRTKSEHSAAASNDSGILEDDQDVKAIETGSVITDLSEDDVVEGDELLDSETAKNERRGMGKRVQSELLEGARGNAIQWLRNRNTTLRLENEELKMKIEELEKWKSTALNANMGILLSENDTLRTDVDELKDRLTREPVYDDVLKELKHTKMALAVVSARRE